jgi:hypothetical protein
MKANRVRLIVSLLLVWNGFGLISNHASAEEKEKRKATIDFEDELVEGELKKPELFYLLQKKQFNYKRLIKLRENFLPEMRRDAEEMRAGSRK